MVFRSFFEGCESHQTATRYFLVGPIWCAEVEDSGEGFAEVRGKKGRAAAKKEAAAEAPAPEAEDGFAEVRRRGRCGTLLASCCVLLSFPTPSRSLSVI